MAEKQRKGLEVQAAIKRVVESRPQLFPWLQFDMDAFWQLCRSRPVHLGGVGYIPYDAIDGYLRLYRVEMTSEERAEFVHNIMVLDDEYMRLQREQAKHEAEGEKKRPKR